MIEALGRMDFVMQAISSDKQFTVSATERAYEPTGLEKLCITTEDWLSGVVWKSESFKEKRKRAGHRNGRRSGRSTEV